MCDRLEFRLKFTAQRIRRSGQGISKAKRKSQTVHGIQRHSWAQSRRDLRGSHTASAKCESIQNPMGPVSTPATRSPYGIQCQSEHRSRSGLRTYANIKDSPEFIPCVVTIYREMMRNYADSNYPERNRIWQRVLSAMKFSLATVRNASAKRGRRKPIEEQAQDTSQGSQPSQTLTDARAIKKAFSLALDGCVSKASNVLDQEFKPKCLSDEEIVAKLRDLHPEIPTTFCLPADAPEVACISPYELREAGRRMAKGAAPGPTGTTDSILRLLLDDEICCLSLCHMLRDLINGALSKQTMTRLTRSRLVAIPKANGGVRPIAVGEVILKLAEIVLLQRHEKKLLHIFSPWQYGVIAKAGCERIIHQLTKHYQDGCAILSVDLRNAFNSPSRDEIAKALFAFASLRPFQRLFAAEYCNPSELLYYGRNGELKAILKSSAGVRQGSPLSSMLFCTFMQPILATIAQEFPTLKIYAFIDDINFAATDPGMLESAYQRLKELMISKMIDMAPQKCVWLAGHQRLALPKSLELEGIQNESEAIKTLGAFVGDKNRVSEKLLSTLNKSRAAFRRLETMGANNISLLLLSRCVNVRHRYQIRVHDPEVTLAVTQQFDAKVNEVLEKWFGKLTAKQISWARLPIRKGGLGLTPSEFIREAAFNKSKFSAMERTNLPSALAETLYLQPSQNPEGNESTERPPAEEATAEEAYNIEVRENLLKDKHTASIILAASEKGNHSWITARTRLVSSRHFALAIMPRLGISHPDLPESLQCPGCHIMFKADAAVAHISGCTKCTGNNATVKHNRMVRRLYELCLKGGIPCELEPRHLSSFKCKVCGDAIAEVQKQEHQRTCGTGSFVRSGPDIVIHWPAGDIYYDFTLIHELSPSNLGKTGARLMKDAIGRKIKAYVSTGLIPQEQFLCIPMLSGGALHKNTKLLLKSLADVCGLVREDVIQDFALNLQEQNGAIVFSQLRNFLGARAGLSSEE